jgi:hypothetical protein
MDKLIRFTVWLSTEYNARPNYNPEELSRLEAALDTMGLAWVQKAITQRPEDGAGVVLALEEEYRRAV